MPETGRTHIIWISIFVKKQENRVQDVKNIQVINQRELPIRQFPLLLCMFFHNKKVKGGTN
ncbi:hypothetical protein EAI28_02055 [Faecalicatena contorta]|nr:hypothetical protein [Faecalicatena contorta]